MTINQIRSVIETATWNRNDFAGYTREEFARANVPRVLSVQIDALRGLEIKPRFNADIERRDWEIACCQKVIDRWLSLTSAAIPSEVVN